jgi:tetratricopeptide (TPR) repeat protein
MRADPGRLFAYLALGHFQVEVPLQIDPITIGRAEADLAKARALDPANGEVELSYAWLLIYIGRRSEAVEAARKAVELDPLSVEAWNAVG